MKKDEEIKVLRTSNFNVTTGMNFIFVDGKEVSINVKTTAQKGFIKFLNDSSEFTHN